MIAAVAENGVIGKDNDLAWNLPDDMKYFVEKTNGHHVIMGRKNWESIPHKFKPLPGRPNLILTRNKEFKVDNPLVSVFHDLQEAIDFASLNNEDELFIIGGAQIYKLGMKFAHRLYITEVAGSPEGDTFFPDFNKNEWKETSRKHHEKDIKHEYSFDFVVYDRKK